jgi:heme/copper-type cytochrome/quinol oxidase subunit 2
MNRNINIQKNNYIKFLIGMKKLLAVFSLLLAIAVLPSITNAQIAMLPGIYVRDLSLPQTSYKAGDTVNGSFSLVNTEKYNVPNIYYMVFLMGDYQNTIPQTQYDHSDMTGPTNLSAGESKIVNFSYKLPNGISGDSLGIQVHATMQNGTGLGWADSMIKITGGTGFLQFDSAYIQVGKDKFGLQDGPMIYSGGKASLNIIFKNNSGVAVSATPVVSIYNRSEVGGLLKTFSEATTTIKSSSNLTLNINLPIFNYDPKVYVGKLDLIDSKGNKVAPSLDFRYIVNGDIVTINNITTSVQTVRKGDSLPLTIDYSGAPFDIMNGKISTTTPADLDIKITNEKGVLVGEYTDKTDFNTGSKKILNVPITANAGAISVEAIASKNGKILADYKATLSELSKTNAQSGWLNFFSLKNISLILLIILAIVVIFLARRSPNRKITILFTLIVILILAIVLVYATSAKAAIDSYTQGGDGSIYNVFSQISPASTNPGGAATLQVSANAQSCSNRAMTFTINAAGQSKSVVRQQYTTDGMYNALAVTFNTPTTPGNYSVNFSATLDNFDHSNWANLTGHEGYTVNCPSVSAPTVTVVASSTCEGGLVVSWSAIGNASGGYQIYKDGSATPLATVSSTTLSYNDTSVLINSPHAYSIMAVNSCQLSAFSTAASANAAPMCPVPAVSPNISAYPSMVPGQCGGKIDVSWNSILHASYYNVYRYNPLTGDVENTSSTTGTTFRDSVTPGSVHKYAVQAFNTVSHTPVSSLQMATSTYDCTPNMVTTCYATQNSSPVLDAASGIPVVWLAPISGGVEPYGYSWTGTTSGSGTTTADVPAQLTATYSNTAPDPVVKSETISANSGTGAYYRDASANCSVNIWNTIRDLATQPFTCDVSPASGSFYYVNRPVNWRVSVPSVIVASSSIHWMGMDGLTGSTAIVTKTYTTVGLKTASVTVFGKDSQGRPWQGTCSTSTNIVSGGNINEQ